jgi:hypothetical protein
LYLLRLIQPIDCPDDQKKHSRYNQKIDHIVNEYTVIDCWGSGFLGSRQGGILLFG